MKAIIFVLMFLVLSSLIIINNNDLKIFEKDGAKKFSELYFGWAEEVYSNAREITGQVVRVDWLPE